MPASGSAPYRGRFAPSPTGPLHFGSLLTAVASFLDARARGGRWLLRIDDLDAPRTVPGAIDDICRTLERHGLLWDGPVMRQTERIELYEAALGSLERAGLLFDCTCSRAHLEGHSVYPGTCRARVRAPAVASAAVRIRVPARRIAFEDRIQGPYAQVLATDVGDFVVRRRDGIFAYQLTVVVDDAHERIDRIVRGADLLDNTPRQLFLFECLGWTPPEYAHVPIVVDDHGEKLSKQTHAPPLATQVASASLVRALALLGQAPVAELEHAPVEQVIHWAIAHWRLDAIPRTMCVAHPTRLG